MRRKTVMQAVIAILAMPALFPSTNADSPDDTVTADKVVGALENTFGVTTDYH